MSNLGRILVNSAERLDLQDVLSIDSYVAGDFKYLLKTFVGDRAFVLKGFDVIDPHNALNTTGLTIRVADSVVYYPTSDSGAFYHGLPVGDVNALPLVPDLHKSATNYVYLTLSTMNTAEDTRAFWDPDLNGGQGGEYTQDVDTETALIAEIGVSVTSFPNGVVPVCIVNMGAHVITSIEDARDIMFRLGSGGMSPDPFHTFDFPALPTSSFERTETPTLMDSSISPNAFQGADKNISSLKDWMDVVMTKLKELGGTTYWYEDVSTYSLINLFIDALASTFKSKGQWIHDLSTPGLVTWTEDIVTKYLSDKREIIIRSGNKTLNDEDTMFLSLIREADINTSNLSISWANGSDECTGLASTFTSLQKGDWVKKKGDPDLYYVRVEEFYDGSYSTVSPAAATIILLSDNYQGLTQSQLGVYTKGVYTASDISVDAKGSASLNAAGGNLMWLAVRSDTIMNIGGQLPGEPGIESTTLSVTFSEGDGHTVKCTSAAPHGLIDGDRVIVAAGSAYYNGGAPYTVQVETSTVFYIDSTVIASESGINVYYSTVTTISRLLLESANHGFEDDQHIIIAGTGTTADGSNLIKVRSSSKFTIPANADCGSIGTATLARVNVRVEFGRAKIAQGESVGIGESEASNIRQFIGMGSATETHPTYNVPSNYNTLRGKQNYNSGENDSLTVRAARLTSMMADRVQDKTIVIAPEGYTVCVKTTSGANQVLTFGSPPPAIPGTPLLNIVMPSCNATGTIGLSGSLTLAVDQAAYFTIDRNASFTLTNLGSLTVSSIATVPLDENVFIFAVRESGTDVWLWDGIMLIEGQNLTIGTISSIINDNAYEESISISADQSAHTLLSLPLDSRTTPPSVQAYVVGKGSLEVYLNDIMLQLGDDWNENGATGTASTDFWMEIPLVIGDIVRLRIDTAGGYTGIGGGSGEANIGFNVGGGEGQVYRDKTSVQLNFRTLKQGPGISIVTAGNEVTISNSGTFVYNVFTVLTPTYPASLSDDVILVNAGVPSTITLPQASTAVGKCLNVKKIDADPILVTIDGFGSELIDGAPTKTTTVQYENFTLVCNGVAWFII
jgi:hypothetical protein